MNTSLIVLLYGFLFAYGVSVATKFIDKMYWITINDIEREEAKEEKDKNKNIPDSCKHIYS